MTFESLIGIIAILVTIIIGIRQIRLQENANRQSNKVQVKPELNIEKPDDSIEIPTTLQPKTETQDQPPINSNQSDAENLDATRPPKIEIKSNHNKSPLPGTIEEEINRLPPYQRILVAEGYVGLRVEWDVTFRDIQMTKKDNEGFVICKAIDRNILIGIIINPTEYPEFKSAKEGAKLIVFGEIQEVYPRMRLTNCSFKFYS